MSRFINVLRRIGVGIIAASMVIEGSSAIVLADPDVVSGNQIPEEVIQEADVTVEIPTDTPADIDIVPPTVDENEDTFQEDAIAEEIDSEEVLEETQEQPFSIDSIAMSRFDAIVREYPISALIYHGDEYTVKTEAGGVDDAGTLYSGEAIYIIAPVISEDNTLWYEVENQDGTVKGFVERYYIASEDQRFLDWEKKNIDSKVYVIRKAKRQGVIQEVELEGEKVVALGASQDEVDNENDDNAGALEFIAVDGDMTLEALGADASDISAFPSSYQAKLKALKSSHPNWTFVPYKLTSLDFNTAVSNEMKSDRSWIEGSANSAYVDKSASRGSGWYLPTKKGVEYYMDPRNSLDDTHVFMFENLTYDSSYQTKSAVQSVVNKTFMKGDMESGYTYAEAFVEIGKKQKVNPVFLAARVVQEQGVNGSSLTSGNYSGYKGYYNFYNIQATGTGSTAIVNGLKYAKSQGWNTRYKSISGGIETLAKNYIQKGQNTLYLQKWDFAGDYYTHQYMQNIRAPYYEAPKMQAAYKNAGAIDSSFVFSIPVFKNMPNEGGSGSTSGSGTSITGCAFENSRETVKAGQTIKLVLNYEPIKAEVKPESIKWKSSNEAVATVDTDGTITCKTSGIATITAEISYVDEECKDKTIKATCSLNVEDCTVKYHSWPSGSVVATKSCAYGDYYTSIPYKSSSVFPEGGTKKGYIFSGWYTGENGTGVMVSPDDRVLGDTDIYPYYIDDSKGYTVKAVGDYYYTGSNITPEVSVYFKDKLLVKGTDYTVTYKNNKAVSTEKTQATITVKGKGNYSGTETITFKILPVSLNDTYVDVQDITVKHTGKTIYSVPTVKYRGTALKKNTDFTIEYPRKGEDDAYKAIGVYPVRVVGKGNYTGSVTVYQNIIKTVAAKNDKAALSKATITGVTNVEYVPDGGKAVQPDGVYSVSMKNEGILREGTDYDVYYLNNTSVGSAKIVFVGKGNYTGTVSKTYKITPCKLTESDVAVADSVSYTKGGTTPEVVVTCGGKQLIQGIDYTVSYKNNTSVTKSKTPAVTVKGKGCYTGTVTKEFDIQAGDLSRCNILITEPVYSPKAGKWVPKFTVTDVNGKNLSAGSDYDKNYIYTYASSCSVMDYSDKKNPQEVLRNAGDTVEKTDAPSAGTRIRLTINPKGNYDDNQLLEEFTIRRVDISKAKISVKSKEYDGTPQILSDEDITVTYNGEILTMTDDSERDGFMIIPTSYQNNVKKGTASAYIKGTGSFAGTKKATFKITSALLKWWWNN